MTLAVVSRVAASYGGALSTSFISGSFTPSANAKLYVCVWAGSDPPGSGGGPFTLNTPTGGSLTYTPKAAAGPSGTPVYYERIAIWEADTGASPGSMTVTMTTSANAYLAYAIFEVTGNSPSIVPSQILASCQLGQTTCTTPTLPSPVTAGNLAIVFAGCNNDSGTQPGVPSGTGFTSLSVGTSSFETFRVSKSTTFTGTSTTFANASDHIGSGSVIFEITEGAPAAATPLLTEDGAFMLGLEDGTLLTTEGG